jgi:hypothetical protein
MGIEGKVWENYFCKVVKVDLLLEFVFVFLRDMYYLALSTSRWDEGHECRIHQSINHRKLVTSSSKVSLVLSWTHPIMTDNRLETARSSC